MTPVAVCSRACASARAASGQASASSRAGLRQQLRDDLGLPDHRDEVGVAAPPGHDVLVQVVGQRTAGYGAQVETHVERVRRGDRPQRPQRGAGDGHQLRRLGLVEVLQPRHVPVGHDHEVPRVVRVQVEHRVHGRAAGDDQPVVVGQRRDPAERAALLGLRRRRGDVGEPVRGPEPPEPVRDADAVARLERRLLQASRVVRTLRLVRRPHVIRRHCRIRHAPDPRRPTPDATGAGNVSAVGEVFSRRRTQPTSSATA